MLVKSLLSLLWMSHHSGTVLATSQDLFFEHFNTPPAAQRPKFRYWLPDASVSADILEEDIANLAKVGAGGFEFVPYYQYGLPAGGLTPTDWEIYGFGTPAFKNIFNIALAAASKNGLFFDLTSAVQGNGVPSEVNTPGLSVELVYGNVSLGPGESYIGVVPPPNPFFTENIPSPDFFFRTDPTFGPSILKAVLALRVDSSQETPSVTFLSVDESSIIDLTDHVSNGTISFQDSNGIGGYRIMSFYERYTNSRTCSGVPDPATFIGNGSWLVDHFTAEGANRTTTFWDQYILDSSNKQMLRNVGRYAWEDSLEFQSAALWTPRLLEDFETARGYSLIPYLPLIFNNNSWSDNDFNPYKEMFLYGSYDENEENRVNIDYRTTLNEGYQEYIEYFETWSHNLGLEYSNQPAYNLPLDMQADIPLVDVPEDESLGFSNNIDAYRQFSGPAHIAGKPLISNEMGAELIAYSLNFQTLLGDVSKAFAGGSNFMVFHGSPYSGPYHNTTWPGFTAFDYMFNEMHNSHQPSWQHYDNFINYVSRTQLILQEGIPRVDLAFYMYSSRWEVETQYSSTNLEELGFTYDYLSPTNFDLPLAFVKNVTLAPDGPAYKALVFCNQSEISLAAISQIQNYASDGLPIFFIGSLPNETIGNNADRNVSQSLDSLFSLSNVHHLYSTEFLPDALNDAEIRPRVLFENGIGLYSVWRSDSETGTNHVYIYNSRNESISNIAVDFSIPSASRPYFLDAWTGDHTPITEYQTTNSGILVHLSFQPGQSRIISFFDLGKWDLANQSVVVTRRNGTVERITYSETSARTVVELSAGSASIEISNSTILNFNNTIRPSFELQTWDISIDDWHPHPNASIIDSQITTHHFSNQSLRSWQEFPEMEDVSGVGKYNSTFMWTSSTSENTSSTLGALISFGPIVHTIRVWANDIQLPTIDITDSTVDISEYLVQGTNRVYVETASNLFNRVKSQANTTLSVGVVAGLAQSSYNRMPRQDYGLLGPVVVTPVLRVEL